MHYGKRSKEAWLKKSSPRPLFISLFLKRLFLNLKAKAIEILCLLAYSRDGLSSQGWARQARSMSFLGISDALGPASVASPGTLAGR